MKPLKNNLPIGCQIVSRRGNDEVLLGIGKKLIKIFNQNEK